MSFVGNLILATVRMAMPILFIALGELYSERAGMVNIGLEGLAAIGSLVGFLVCFVTGSTWLGILCGALVAVRPKLVVAVALQDMGARRAAVHSGISSEQVPPPA